MQITTKTVSAKSHKLNATWIVEPNKALKALHSEELKDIITQELLVEQEVKRIRKLTHDKTSV